MDINSNIYTRRVLAGEFQVVCPWLLRELVDLGLWDDNMKNMIIAHNGSIQNIPNIPDDVKAIYKTVWEISQKKVLDLAADRGAYIDQSQSMNVHLQSPTLGQLTSMHFYGWKKGLKTGMYYLRTRPAAQAIQFTVDQSVLKEAKKQAGSTTLPKPSAAVPANGIPTPSSSVPSTPQRPVATAQPSVSSTSTSVTTSAEPSQSSSSGKEKATDADVTSVQDALADLTVDEKTRQAAEADPEFAAALRRQKERELEEAKLLCSLENKEACVMCSG